jgi:hypothetical protein
MELDRSEEASDVRQVPQRLTCHCGAQLPPLTRETVKNKFEAILTCCQKPTGTVHVLAEGGGSDDAALIATVHETCARCHLHVCIGK